MNTTEKLLEEIRELLDHKENMSVVLCSKNTNHIYQKMLQYNFIIK